MSTQTPNTTPANNTPAQVVPPVSASFAAKVERQFIAEAGSGIVWSDYHRSLAQHLYLKIDASLKTLNEKRGANDKITWQNIDMVQLALDSVNRVQLEIDALMKNFLHVVPYKDESTKLFKLDLRIGYEGYAYIKKKFALDPSVAVRTELVYETDEFYEKPEFISGVGMIQAYHFKPLYPFDSAKRGKVVGGFGYISYANPRKNQLVIVDQRDFDRAQRAAKTQDFWAENKSQEEMKAKTVIFRVYEEIPMDPARVNAAMVAKAFEANLDYIEAEVRQEIAENSGQHSLPDTPEGEQRQSAVEDDPADE
jgi:recombination protein RecT